MKNKWEKLNDVDEILRSANALASPPILRKFAVDLCRRITKLCTDPSMEKIIELGRKRAEGSITNKELDDVGESFDEVYNSLYPGHGEPSTAALAYCAAGEVAFTESDLDSAINAACFAARTVASAKADKASDDEYDNVFEKTYQSERQAQVKLLKKYLSDVYKN